MADPVDGQVHKIVRVIGTSPTSWEGAAQAAVSEAGRTIQDMRTATVVDSDLVIDGDQGLQYRVKLELFFQLDRFRTVNDGRETVRVRRFLIVANQTLASPGLHELIVERDSVGPSEFHVLVPEHATPTTHLGGPAGLDGAMPIDIDLSADEHDWDAIRQEAELRLETFRRDLAHLGGRLSGEVAFGDPLTAVRRVMQYASFDEIIVSTLPSGISRWLKLDLPTRLQRAFNLPVTPLIQAQATH